MHNSCSPQNCTTLLYFDRLVGHSWYREKTPQFEEIRLQQKSISPSLSRIPFPQELSMFESFSVKEEWKPFSFSLLDGRNHARESTTDNFQNQVIPNLWLITVTSTITPGLIMNTSRGRYSI